MDGTQWECNSSDTLLNDFFSQDDLKQLAVDAGIMLECPLLVLDDTFHVVAYIIHPVLWITSFRRLCGVDRSLMKRGPLSAEVLHCVPGCQTI